MAQLSETYTQTGNERGEKVKLTTNLKQFLCGSQTNCPTSSRPPPPTTLRAVCTKCPELDSMDNNVTQARSASLLVCLARTRTRTRTDGRSSLCLSRCVSVSFRAACHVARQRRLDKFITTLLALLPLWL